jgi:hypothetical protein
MTFGQQKNVRTCTRIPLPLAFHFLRFGGAQIIECAAQGKVPEREMKEKDQNT